MKLSSFFFLTLVLLAFVGIQGWVLVQKFVAPVVFVAREAVILGRIVEVRTPFEGVVWGIGVQEDERVEEGRELFRLSRTVTHPVTQEQREEEFTVAALRPGVVTNIQAVEGGFVQSDQKLAEIADNSADVLYVRARLSVPPRDVPKIQPLLRASVSAPFVNGGQPLQAVVSAIDPVYDAATETLEVRMRLITGTEELQRLSLGLPVDARVVLERDPPTNPVIAFFARLFPTSQAHQ